MLKRPAALSIWISLIFIVGCTSNDRSTAVGKDERIKSAQSSQSGPIMTQLSGYPDKIRDGLAPAQYFRMAEVLLDDYDLTNARRCLKKLREDTASPEAQNYADLLEKTAMPKDLVSDDALKLLKDADKIEERRDFGKAKEMYQALVAKFPRFEWPYVALANHYAYFRRDQKTAEELLEKALAVNPNNVYVLRACVNLANSFQQHEKAYEYCLRIRALDPTYSSYVFDWELDNHDRATHLKNIVHRAGPQVKAASFKESTLPAPVPLRGANHNSLPDAVRASINESMRKSMLQTRERAENFPPQIINESGEIQIAFGPNIDTQGSFSNNLLAVQSGRRTQYWNKQGKQAFARSFDSGMDFSQGLAAVKDGHWGFIDGTGQFVIANNYDYALSFSEGLAAVLVGPYWGFVNQRGEVVIEPIYEKVLPFSNGLALVKLRDKVGYLDNNGHLSIPAVFDSGRSFSEGLAEVGFLDNEKHELRLCYINTSGQVCIDTSKIEIEAEPAESEADIYKLDDGKTVFGFKSAVGMSSGEHLPRDFHCGLAGIKLGKNYGYINKDGKVVVKPVYNVVYDFSENLATVRPGFNFDKAVIDTSGRIIVGPQYQEISQFHDGIAVVNRWEHTSANALWGYINTKGEQTLPLQYFEAAPFSNGLARVRPTPMSLAAAKYVAVDSTPVMTALPANMSPWAQSAVNKTAAAWPADTICDVDKRARFTFQLDHAGNAYDITFAGGCASPKTMIATVHSLLFAMPFEKPPGSAPIVLDLESDSDGKPKIRIGLAKDKALNSEAKILDGMPGEQTSTSKNVVRQWMYEKLLFLCEKVAKYPDSPSVKAELGKVLKAFALNPASAHDWLCVARGNPGELALRQNPDDKDERNCNAPVGALFQAWRLQKQKDNLYELEDAYRCKLALDLLRLNGDKPLFRGIAAELIDEYSTAVNNYSQCASASPFAKKLAIRFAHKVTSGSVGKNAEYAVNGKDWRTVVKWLPVDSEVLIAVLNPQPETKGDPNRMVSSLFESMQGMLGAMKGEGVDIRFALHGGRNFHSPRDIGIGTQAGADIRIFGSALPASDRNAGTAPRTDSDKVTAAAEKIEGFDIVVEEWKPRFSQSSVSFTARPYANVEITATDRHYLRQILRRMRSKPIDRAFPDSLPEWAAIDLKSDCWSVRHFDRGYAPFDGSAPKTLIGSEAEDEGNEGAIADTSVAGFTFCGNKDGAFKVSYLGSNPITIKAMAGVWNHYPEINTGQFWGTGKGPKDYKMSPLKVTFSADKKAVTAAGKTTKVTAPMLNLMLMNQLGYMVAL